MEDNGKQETRLKPYLSPVGAWALSFGTAMGWGALIVTGNGLLQAEPLGGMLNAVPALIIGALIMLLVSKNYHYMINRYPEAGGAYAYAREAFGYDHGFIVAWFLVLTYGAIFCASATAIPFIARYFTGELFQFGYMYTIFGHPVYLGEVLLSAAFIVLAALLCMKRHGLAAGIAVGLAGLVTVVIAVCFVAMTLGAGGGAPTGTDVEPAEIPEMNKLLQMILAVAISPLIFIGIESISYSAEEFTFSRKRSFRILTAAVITAALVYLFLLLLSGPAGQFRFGNWVLPALLGLILISMFGSLLALSRLTYAMARDNVISARFGERNKSGAPANVILLIAVVSVFVPLAGETAAEWIVDVAVLGVTIACGVVSAATFKTARLDGDKTEIRTGLAGMILMICVLLGLLLPSLLSAGIMSAEPYLLFALWAILGLLVFRNILKQDGAKRFGRSAAVWIALLVPIFSACLAWLGTSAMQSADTMAQNMNAHWNQDAESFFREQVGQMKMANRMNMMIVSLVMAVALATLISSYTMFTRKIKENEVELANARIRANTDALTGVRNKMAYSEAEADLNRHLQKQGGTPFAIAICDVNGLKQVNDTMGHKAGDEYLRKASMMICDLFRHSPVFRIGGDEFAVILTNRDYEQREELLSEIHHRSAENIGTGEAVVACGIAVFDPEKDHDVQSVYDRADERMYQEKSALKQMGAADR